MLVHVEIPDMSLNLQDPLLRLTGFHPRQTGGPLFCQILTDFARGGRRANSTPGPARGVLGFYVAQTANVIRRGDLGLKYPKDSIFAVNICMFMAELSSMISRGLLYGR